MALISSRAAGTVVPAPAGRPARRLRAGAAGLLTAGVLVAATACGGSVPQTSRPYTPADGVNFDVGDSGNTSTVVHVRNLLVISRAPGQGFLSATMSSASQDTLTGVTGSPIKTDATNGAPFTATITSPPVLGSAPVILTNGPLITLTSADIKAGLEATVTVQFAKAGPFTVRTPIVDGNLAPYSAITPAPASPSATPSA